jgi:hypothetical protein
LNKLPEVKKFLREVIEPGHYVSVTVRWSPGSVPEIHLFDAAGGLIDKHFVDHLSFAELNTLVRSKGFRRKDEQAATS